MASSRAWNLGMASRRSRQPAAAPSSGGRAMDDFLHMPFEQLREEMGGGILGAPSPSSLATQFASNAGSGSSVRHAPSGSRRSADQHVGASLLTSTVCPPRAKPLGSSFGFLSCGSHHTACDFRHVSCNVFTQTMEEMERMVRTLMAIGSPQGRRGRDTHQSRPMSYEQMLQLDRSNVRRGVKPSAMRRLEKVKDAL